MTEKGSKGQAATDIVEWGIALLGIALVFTALGIILFRAIREDSTPVDLSVSVEKVEKLERKFRVDFRIDNSGSETAAAVSVEGELMDGAKSVEKSNAMITYAPANSTRQGGMFFTNDPHLFELRLRATGFEKP